MTSDDPRARRPAVDSVMRRAGCPGAGRLHSAPGLSLALGAVRVTDSELTRSMISSDPTALATVYVCVTCRNRADPESELRPGALLAAATMAAAEGTSVIVQPVECLANCSRGPSAAMRCNGSWTYVFGELDISSAVALVEGARLLAQAANGILPWRGRPEPLKRGLIARVPPIDADSVRLQAGGFGSSSKQAPQQEAE